MLGPLRLICLVKLARVPGPGIASICSSASQNARVWLGSPGRRSTLDNTKRSQEDSEETLDMDPVEAKLESLVNDERRMRQTVKFHKIRRQMSKPGAPERRLTWEAIEQIRYLKQESPQEWTVLRLANSFSVSPDVISRILRSKFTPTIERRCKQDSKVMATVRQLSLGEDQTDRSKKDSPGLPMPERVVPAMLSSGNPGALTSMSPEALAPIEFETRLFPCGGNVTSVSRRSSQISTTPTLNQSTLQEPNKAKQEPIGVEERKGLEKEDEQDWDRVYLTEEELEELIHTLHGKPSRVEQKGREFFDSEGNFLYRI
ncbi:neugrin [Hoplias malabaricus]|uniref:neugrin n=1 Tax=Hoplias malabaricus TaxID=27720 RepID=UPI003462B1B0